MGRPLLIVLLIVMALLVVSWTLGELLRQRKGGNRQKQRKRKPRP